MRNAIPVCDSAFKSARFAPSSRADAAIAETQGEHAMMNAVKAAAEDALIAAERSAP